MVFLDEKGRVFSRINVIDFFALVVCALVIILFYFGFQLYSSNYKERVRHEIRHQLKKELKGVDIGAKRTKASVVVLTKMNNLLRKTIAIGDLEIQADPNYRPRKITHIQSLLSRPSWYLVLLEGEVRRSWQGVLSDMRGREIRMGDRFQFMGANYTFKGEIVQIILGRHTLEEFKRSIKELEYDLE